MNVLYMKINKRVSLATKDIRIKFEKELKQVTAHIKQRATAA